MGYSLMTGDFSKVLKVNSRFPKIFPNVSVGFPNLPPIFEIFSSTNEEMNHHHQRFCLVPKMEGFVSFLNLIAGYIFFGGGVLFNTVDG